MNSADLIVALKKRINEEQTAIMRDLNRQLYADAGNYRVYPTAPPVPWYRRWLTRTRGYFAHVFKATAGRSCDCEHDYDY